MIGLSLVEDAQARPFLAVLEGGEVALGARAGALERPEDWVRPVRTLDLVGSDAPSPAAPAPEEDDEAGADEGGIALEEVATGRRLDITLEDLERLPHDTVGRNGRNVEAVPLARVLEHAGIAAASVVRVIGTEEEVRLAWPGGAAGAAAADSQHQQTPPPAGRSAFLYVNQRGSVLLLLDPAAAGESAPPGGTGDGMGGRRAGSGRTRGGGRGGGGGGGGGGGRGDHAGAGRGEGQREQATEPEELRDVCRIEVLP